MRWSTWAMVVLVGCSGQIGDMGDFDGGVTPVADGGPPAELCDGGTTDAPEVRAPREPVSASRVLRRVELALRGRAPTAEEAAALASASTPEAQRAVIEAAIDDALASTDFYSRAVDFGHHWMRNGSAVNGTSGDGYMGNDSMHLAVCRDGTVHAGAFHVHEAHLAVQESVNCDISDAPTRDVIDPWWAPGTTVRLVGDAAAEVATVTDADGVVHDCGIVTETYYSAASENGCGCGPHAVWCYPETGGAANNDRVGSQRRALWDEPARLVAHLAWHDRALSDVVLGNYTVANTRLRAWYLRFGRQTGLFNAELDANDTWFRPEVGPGERDPLHPAPDDPEAWKELVVETLAPQLLSLTDGERSADPSRTLQWNPVDNEGPAPGLPAAGVLTMPGMMSYFPRERVRAARFIEIFSCRSFDPPPADQVFPPVGRDIATSGPCMHCHVLMDPVAIAFRRWIFRADGSNYVERSRLAGMANLPLPGDLFEPSQEYSHRLWFSSGAARWHGEWVYDSVMTPVSQADLEADNGRLFYDTIPPEYSLYGEHTDGTMGPLAFGKVLVSSGEFDQCAARRLYEYFGGRPLNPETEARFIQQLGEEFAAGGRAIRPFVRSILVGEEFSSEPTLESAAPDAPPVEPGEGACAVSDNDLIRLRLAPACAGCHGEGTSRPFFASLNAFEDLLVYNPRFVVAGSPDESELLKLLEGTSEGAYPQMPTTGEPFAVRDANGETQITMDELRAWITTLTGPTRPPSADARASATRRLRSIEYINALQIALGQSPGNADDPLVETHGTPPMNPDLANERDFYRNSFRHQVFLMTGGAAYLQQRQPEPEWSTTSLLAITQLAQGACSMAVENNNPVLFSAASPSDTLATAEPAIRANIAALFERFLHVAPTEEEVTMFLENVYAPAESTSTAAAWTQVCSSLARDPLFITF